MKLNSLAFALVLFSMTSFAEPEIALQDEPLYRADELSEEDHKTEHEHVFTPEEEEKFKSELHLKRNFRFPQTQWNECTDNPSGNYTGDSCARARQISVILDSYLKDFIYECVDAGLRVQGSGMADEIHITHDGILGNSAHSPRSLHAEARAIDIKGLRVKTTSGNTYNMIYAGPTNRPFYQAFRACWGRVVHRENGCPFYNGNPEHTGTIGWENRNHLEHMHTSVPYCVNGRYGAGYYQR